MIRADLLVRHIGQLLTMTPSEGDAGATEAPLGLRSSAALAALDGQICWIGDDAAAEGALELEPEATTVDAAGAVVLPGLVDPHTHVVFTGSRHQEFALRIAGADYLEILAAGGGILNTMKQIRAASVDELVAASLPRLRRMLDFGVTTCEVKSGYGLDRASEVKMLEAVAKLDALQPIRLIPTFLGAHVFPPEHKDKPEVYVDQICQEMIPEVASRGLARMCDVFLDRGVFDRDQARRVLETARSAGLELRLHAGQFTDLGGPELAAELGARSADHMEHFSDEGARAMAEAGVVACLLPGAALSLGMSYPEARRLRAAGVEVALSTDCNPGTSMTENLPLMMTLGATSMGLTVVECVQAVTTVAARALPLEGVAGALAPGRQADFVIFDVPDYRSLVYHFGVNHASAVYVSGRRATPASQGSRFD